MHYGFTAQFCLKLAAWLGDNGVAHINKVTLHRPRLVPRWLTFCGYTSWLCSVVGGTPVFGRRTGPVLRSACSRRVTTMWVNRPLQVSQLGQLSLSSF